MRYRKYYTIIIMSVCMLAGITVVSAYLKKSIQIDNWMFTDEQIESYGPFWITVPAAENDGLYTDVNGIVVEDERDIIYLILPDTTNKRKIVAYVRDGYESNYEARRILDFSDGDVKLAGKTIKLYHTDFPMLFIETDKTVDFSEFRNAETKDVECPGVLYTNEITSPMNVVLKPRGNSTWGGMHKKPYSLYSEEKINLLGNKDTKSWNLIADAWDKSLLKNYTFNKIATNVGIKYEPDVKHVLLYINRNFEGVYLLTTKVGKVGNNQNQIPLSEDDMLMVWEGTHPEQVIEYEAPCEGKIIDDDGETEKPYVDLLYPKNLSDNLIESKRVIIQNYIDAMYDENDDTYLDYIDVDNFFSFYWIEELSMNFDAYGRSIYSIYDSSDAKMYYEPIWDMDLTFGVNVDKIDFPDMKGWHVRQKGFYEQLFEHPGFEDEAKEAYSRLGLNQKFLDGVEIYREEQEKIMEFGELDYKVWKDEWRGDGALSECTTYKEVSDRVLEQYIERLEWINSQMLN